MQKFIFEKRQPTAKEKASCILFDRNNKSIIFPTYKGTEEAEARLTAYYFVIAFTTNKNGYIPARFRSDNYFIV